VAVEEQDAIEPEKILIYTDGSGINGHIGLLRSLQRSSWRASARNGLSIWAHPTRPLCMQRS
jgi:hypothetical protein